jgi:hypothetical protein
VAGFGTAPIDIPNCERCHPAHRSDGDLAGYPFTLGGNNFYAGSDNRLANGGCFVGRDVHSNPNKDGAETDEHLNAVGQWRSNNAFDNQTGLAGSNQDARGIRCSNCHTQLSQEIWKAENMVDLINGIPGKQADGVTGAVNVRELSLQGIADVVAGGDLDQVLAWLDPTIDNPKGDFTRAVWNPQSEDANVATIEAGAAAGENHTRRHGLGGQGDGIPGAGQADFFPAAERNRRPGRVAGRLASGEGA